LVKALDPVLMGPMWMTARSVGRDLRAAADMRFTLSERVVLVIERNHGVDQRELIVFALPTRAHGV
jgi:hypothetical protein